MLAWLLSTSKIGGTVAAVGLAAGMKLNTTVAPFILRGVSLLGVDSANTPMALRQKIWNKLAVEWRPDRVHDQVRTIDFDELPTHFDAYLKGMVRGRTVVRIAPDTPSRRAAHADGRATQEVCIAGRSPTARRSGASEAALVDWQTPFASVLDYSRRRSRKWFVGGRTNLCHNAVDRHLAARGEQTALIYISTETGETQRYTYRELAAEVNRFAAMLQGAGRRARRSRADLHADDRRGGVRDARVRAHRRDPFGRVRRVRGGEPRDAHRRRDAEGDGHLRRRHARRQADALQASGRRGDAARRASAAQGASSSTAASIPAMAIVAGPRPRLRDAARAA